MDDRKTILLVEDEALIAISQKKVLERHGYTVLTAHSGNKAIEAVRTTLGIDLILMDINLGKGKMDGTEAAEIILKDRDIPILFLSSYTQPEIVERTEKITSYGYVVKDSGETVLNTSIKMAFKLHEAHRQVQHNAEQFRSITNTSIDGFWLLNKEGHILDANEAYCVMTGYSRDELLKMSIPDLEAVEDPDMVMEHMQKLIEKGSDRFESRHRCKDGRIIDVEVSTVLTGEQRCLVFIQNITERKQADNRLRQSEEKFRILIETSNEGIWMMNGDHETTFVNRAMAHMMGYEPSEMLGEKVESFFFPEDMGYHAERMTKRHMGRDEVYERRFKKKDASELWTLVSAKALTDDEGGFAGSFAMFTDITAHKHMEKALRESEEQYRNIFTNMLDGFAVHEIILDDAGNAVDYRFLAVNPAFERLTGLNAGDLIGKTVKEVLPDIEPAWIEKYGDVAINGTQLHFEQYSEDLKRHYEVTAYRPAPLQFACTFVDITERKLAEDRLEKSKERFRAIADYTYDWENWVGPDGQLIWVNPAVERLTGYSVEECLAMSDFPLSIIGDADREKVAADFAEAVKGASSDRLDFRVRRKDGTMKWVSASYQQIYDESGNHLGHRSSIRDITSRKLTEENLQRERDLFQTVMNASRNVHLGYLDREFNLVKVNEAYAATCGYRPEDMIGKNHFVLYPNPENEAIFARIRDTGEPFKARDYPFEFPDQPGRGVTYWDWTLTPHKDPSGRVAGLVFALVETTERKRAEAALRESEKKFRAIYEQAPVGVALIDSNSGSFIEVNPKYCEIVGRSQEEMTATDFQTITHPDDLEADLANMKGLREGRVRSFSMEKRYILPNNSVVWVNLTVVRMWEETEVPAFHLAIVEDITEGKKAQEALRESEEKFRLVFESANVGKSITLPTGEMFVNKAFCDMLGYTGEELRNKRWQDITPPDEIDPIQKRLDSVFNDGQNAVRFDKRYIHKNGSYVWADVSVAAHRDNEGKILFFITTCSDITGSKTAQELLLASEEKFRKIFYSAPVLLTISDIENGRCVEVNNAFLEASGFSRDEVIVRSSTDLGWISKEDRERLVAVLRTEGRVAGMDLTLTAKDGNRVHCLYCGEIITVGEKEHLLSIALDVTSQKRAENLIRASLHEKEILLREIHHRVKNNLMVVSSVLNLQSETIRDRKAKDLLEDCRKRVQAMSLVHNRLYRSADLGRISISEYAGDLLSDISRSYGDLAGNIALVTDVGDMTFDIDTAIPLGLIMNELVSNAMKHAFPGETKGTITVKLHGEEGNLRLTIKDNGIGFPKDLDFTATESLGMQLVITLVEQLEGDIELIRDHGTEFRVTFGTGQKS